jgi:acyl-CoA thioesterase
MQAVLREPFAQAFEMQLLELEDGRSVVQMIYDPEKADNIYQRAHGGALYGLIDEAFETAAQTDGTIAVAMNINVSYVASPEKNARLTASAKRISQTKKTAGYDIKVSDDQGKLIAYCHALAYRTGKPIPFLR